MIEWRNEKRKIKELIPCRWKEFRVIVTSSYSQMKNFTKEGFIPVSISVSEPKYIKTPVRKISVLQPRYAILKENDYDIYKRIYVADMLKLDLRGIYKKIELIGENVALLCYESWKSIQSGETFCHRRILAELYEEKFGIVIPEYEVTKEINVPQVEQMILWRL